MSFSNKLGHLFWLFGGSFLLIKKNWVIVMCLKHAIYKHVLDWIKLNFWCISGKMTLPDSWVMDGQRVILGHCKKLGGPLKVPEIENCCDCHQFKKQPTDTRETFLRFSKHLTDLSLQQPPVSSLSSPLNCVFRNILDSLAVPPVIPCRFRDMFLTITIQPWSGFSDYKQVVSSFPLGALPFHTFTSP